MPCPTAKRPEEAVVEANPAPQDLPLLDQDHDELQATISIVPLASNLSIPTASDEMAIDQENRPMFPPAQEKSHTRVETRKISVPPHRMTPLKRDWPQIYAPVCEHLKIQMRMNPSRKCIELRSSKYTTDPGTALQKGEDFLRSYIMGFDLEDAIALLRLDDLYTETFEIKDVKTLQGDHLARAIGRIAGKDGKTKFAIENASRTRIVLADSKIHILGSFQSIHMARESIVDLIRGKQPGKVYGNLQKISRRMKERF